MTLTAITCACGRTIAGTPPAVAHTYGVDHTGPDHRVARVTDTTAARLAAQVRR